MESPGSESVEMSTDCPNNVKVHQLEKTEKDEKSEERAQTSSCNSNESEQTEGNENDDECESRDRAFSIDLIWRKLGQCLNHGDLKSLRLVNRQFNHFVLYETNFTRRTVVVLFGHRLSLSMFGSSSHIFRHFKFMYSIFNGDDELDWFYPLLQSAQSFNIGIKSNGQLESPPLDKLLEAPDQLKQLVLTAKVLESPSTVIALNKLSDGAKKNLENLQELHISSSPEDHVSSVEDFVLSLAALTNHLKNLQTIRIDRIFCEMNDPEYVEMAVDQKDMPDYCSNFNNIIEQNGKTLIKLNVQDFFLCCSIADASFKSIFKMKFPRLKSLSLRVAEFSTPSLIKFLDLHPNLEELDLTIIRCFPKILLAKIREKCLGLKRLRIKTKAITFFQSNDESDENDENEEEEEDDNADEEKEKKHWEFLKDMKNLEDFELEFIPSSTWTNHLPSSCHKFILSCLPKSMRKISMKNVPTRSNGAAASNSTQCLVPADFHGFDLDQLSYLTIQGMKNTIDNTTMEFICKNMRNLKHLDVFGSTENLSNFGVTGMKNGKKVKGVVMPALNAGFSLKNLTDLKFLSISGGKLTNKAFDSAVKFKELKYLKLGLPNEFKNKDLTTVAINSILKNNPSLEQLVTSGYNKNINFPTLQEMTKLHARIKDHVKLVIEPRDYDESSSDEDEDDFDSSLLEHLDFDSDDLYDSDYKYYHHHHGMFSDSDSEVGWF